MHEIQKLSFPRSRNVSQDEGRRDVKISLIRKLHYPVSSSALRNTCSYINRHESICTWTNNRPALMSGPAGLHMPQRSQSQSRGARCHACFTEGMASTSALAEDGDLLPHRQRDDIYIYIYHRQAHNHTRALG